MSIATMGEEKLSMNSNALNDPVQTASVLERIAQGDASAVEECLDQYGGLVWSIVNRVCGKGVDTEDVTQEVFIDIWKNAAQYDPSVGTEKVFVAMIARRRAIDRVRAAVRRQKLTASAIDADVEALPLADPLELADEAAKAASCMSRLSHQQRSILTLSIHQGQSHSNISQNLGMPLGTVKSFARRALIQLRDCMRRSTPQLQGESS